ncbi:MAG: T9SS type A sorting domain-containing protein [Melioribacteraceae bacterium]|nr:T9SS type A sorting domain-containing protein [Melioribacteraceae bacterium]
MKKILVVFLLTLVTFAFAQSGSSVEYQSGTTLEVSTGAMFEADAFSGSGTIIGGENIYISGSPLPVELISFLAILNNNSVTLEWSTETEVNNFGFDIERSVILSPSKNDTWQKIGFVKGNGNSNSPKHYSFVDQNPIGGKLKYRLKQIDSDGSFSYSNEIEVDVNIPKVFVLEQNYPNPFNPSTLISWQSPIASHQTLKIYDVLGNEIATLVDEYREAGRHTVEFSSNNIELSSGIYFYKLKIGNFTQVKKMLLLR